MVGKRIRYFRGRKDLTQKEFGKLLGFSDSTAEIRIAQYEKERRAPKQDLANKMAEVLGVNPHALMVPELDAIKPRPRMTIRSQHKKAKG